MIGDYQRLDGLPTRQEQVRRADRSGGARNTATFMAVTDCGFSPLGRRGAKSDTQQGFRLDMLAPLAL